MNTVQTKQIDNQKKIYVCAFKTLTSGIDKEHIRHRGTIGGKPGETLSPLDTVKFSAAFGSWLMQKTSNRKIVIGRDGRISGAMVQSLVVNTIMALGFDIIDLGWSTTPTVEMAVKAEKAAGGIIITASHNPQEWNALKLLNGDGEFISAEDGKEVLAKADAEDFIFAPVETHRYPHAG